jgi:thiol-disulfide isomerase/thioredoxin
MKRRTVALGSLGIAAGLTGVGAALWRDRESRTAAEAVWRMRFPRPGGGELALAALRGRPLLLNFWATWCVPCVTEMPLLARFAAERPDWQIVGLAVDREEAVSRFVAEHRIAFPVALANLQGIELSRSLGNTAGGLPFTVAFDAAGRPEHRHLGALDEAELGRWSGR